MTVKYECKNCQNYLRENEIFCPKCGFKERNIYVDLYDRFNILDMIQIKLKDFSGFVLLTSLIRNKISGFTKKLAKETLVFDHRDLNITKKYHHVEEMDDNGNKKVVHNENIEYPSKKRPNKNLNKK